MIKFYAFKRPKANKYAIDTKGQNINLALHSKSAVSNSLQNSFFDGEGERTHHFLQTQSRLLSKRLKKIDFEK